MPRLTRCCVLSGHSLVLGVLWVLVYHACTHIFVVAAWSLDASTHILSLARGAATMGPPGEYALAYSEDAGRACLARAWAVHLNSAVPSCPQAECLSASTPALATIDEYHDKIPVRNALDIPFLGPTGAPGPEVVVCLAGQECDPPAPPPAAADSEDAAEAPGTGGAGPDILPAAGPRAPATTEPPLDREMVTLDDLSASSASRGCAAIGLAAAAAVAVFAPALLR